MLYTNPNNESKIDPTLDSDTSSNTPTQLHDTLQEKDTARIRETLERLDQELEQLTQEYIDVSEVMENNETLPANEKDNDERVDPYKEEYPDYFNDESSTQKALGQIKDELKDMGREKVKEKRAIEKELPSGTEWQSKSTKPPVNTNDDLLDMPNYLDDVD